MSPPLTPPADAFRGLDLLSSAVVVLDDELAVRYANAASENLLQTSLAQLRGRPLNYLFGYTASLAAALDNARHNNWSYTGHNIEWRKGDAPSIHLDCTVTPISSAAGSLVLELRPIDQQIRASREERMLEQQQTNRELIRNLAHEIKNPLGGIRGAAQLLEHELQSEALREYTQVIIDEADRLQNLMQRLLSPHRAMHPAEINVHEVLERVRSLLLAEFTEGLVITRDYDTSLPDLIADREQLIQVFLNIARNAAQAVRGHGEIVLRTRAVRQVTLAKRRYRLAVAIEVADNGPGIPPEIRDSIFYPLVTGRDDGTGLGLTLAQSFVQQHHGSIECQSEPGDTVFRVILPVDRRPNAARKA
ncbi:MAG TPA: nitrogen regulation protein NR(II) [Rhodocyclaceae bacterium]